MNLALFLVFALGVTVVGPLIADSSGADWVMPVANTVIFGSLMLMAIFGVRAVLSKGFSLLPRMALIFLVFIAVVAAFAAAGLQMG